MLCFYFVTLLSVNLSVSIFYMGLFVSLCFCACVLQDSKVLSQGGELTLESVTLSDAGLYLCVGAVPTVPGLENQANVTIIVQGTTCTHNCPIVLYKCNQN